MSTPAADAFLALWNGIADPALQAEYEAWHTFEHVPERVGSPGFAGAMRYVRCPGHGGPSYFTWYALESLDALHTSRYRELIDHPTAWSARMRNVLSDFCREPCEVLSSHGMSTASCLVTLRVHVHAPQAVAQHLQDLVDAGQAVCATWGRLDQRSGHPLSTPPVAGSGDSGVDAVILLQHLREPQLLEAARELQSRLQKDMTLRAPIGCYQLQSTVRQADLPLPLTRRQRPRHDLLQRFTIGDSPT